MTRQGVRRVAVLVARHGPALVVGLCVLGAVSLGSAAWLYTNPPTTEVTDATEQVSVRSDLHTSAVVTENNTLYPEGTTVRDQPVYFVSATPTATVSVRTAVSPSDPGATRVNQSLALVVRGVRDGQVFWEETRVLASDEVRPTNGTATTNATVDMRRVYGNVRAVTNDVGTAGSVEVLLRMEVGYETARYSGTESETVPVQLTERWYSIDRASIEQADSTPVTRTVVVPQRNRLGYQLPGVLGGVALVLGGATGVLFTRLDDPVALERELQRDRYAEWISSGELDSAVGERFVSLQSLEDVVDLAIDTHRRVIFDAERELYAVIDGDIVYYYDPSGRYSSVSDSDTDDRYGGFVFDQ
ncbi:DUF5305 family protein [Halomarina halobia]|uniref:DUF5305 family protein n=1 Tax=Halomarina halobia TaxID=3033386 RepID=A0ABD6ACR7_9EURY|nr:DUF5305 family protein [Halomarina sp. PSR21]